MPTTVYKSAAFDLGYPPGVMLQTIIGMAHLGQFVFVFAQDSKGAIWCRWWYLNNWQPWVELPGPACGLLKDENQYGSGVVTQGGSIWLYAVGTDGNLWCNIWSGQYWQWFPAPGVPVGAPAGTKVTKLLGAVANAGFAVAVQCSDGNTWNAVWNGAMWLWIKLTGTALAAVTPDKHGKMTAYPECWRDATQLTWTTSKTDVNVGQVIAAMIAVFRLQQASYHFQDVSQIATTTNVETKIGFTRPPVFLPPVLNPYTKLMEQGPVDETAKRSIMCSVYSTA
ncbi:MAG: hypothetical protein RL514_3657 [Verrucomicrobiota bacterium]|jgi:hypothetical protein